MKILIVSNKENQYKIENIILNYSDLFDGLAKKYEFCSYSDSILSNIGDYSKIIFDEEHFKDAKKILEGTGKVETLYIWSFGLIIPIINPQLLNLIQNNYLSNKDWDNVKRINRIKIEINCLRKKEVLDTYPSQLQLESTSYCNAQCIMCSHYYAGNEGALDMSKVLQQRLEELYPYLEILILHGNGEPFMSKYFEESINKYNSYHISLTTNTNLSIINDKVLELINKTFVNIRVSCDACRKDTYEGIRRNLSYSKFVKHAKMLKEKCPEISKSMACVVMRQNIKELPEMVRFAAELGYEEIIFSNLGTNPMVGNELDHIKYYPYFSAKQFKKAIANGKLYDIKVVIPNSYDLSLDDEEECKNELDKIDSLPFFKSDEEIKSIREFAESVIGDEYRIIEDLNDCYWEKDLYSCAGICEWCIEKTFIDLRGNVYVCCINASYRVGNIFDYDSFMSLWNNETYRRIRSLFYQGKLPGFCDNCQFILNGSLKRLEVSEVDESFYNRRHISKFYKDYCEKSKDRE